MANSSLIELGELPYSVPNDKTGNFQNFQDKSTMLLFIIRTHGPPGRDHSKGREVEEPIFDSKSVG